MVLPRQQWGIRQTLSARKSRAQGIDTYGMLPNMKQWEHPLLSEFHCLDKGGFHER
jgi:hypothetical protein